VICEPSIQIRKARNKKEGFRKEIEKILLAGIIWICQIHKIAGSKMINKYDKCNNPTHLIPVMVNFGHLRNTLIPIHEHVMKPKGKSMGKVNGVTIQMITWITLRNPVV